MYNTELEVAKKAEQMLEAALRQKTSSFRNHINRNPEDKSLKDATAKATGRTALAYGKDFFHAYQNLVRLFYLKYAV